MNYFFVIGGARHFTHHPHDAQSNGKEQTWEQKGHCNSAGTQPLSNLRLEQGGPNLGKTSVEKKSGHSGSPVDRATRLVRLFKLAERGPFKRLEHQLHQMS